MKYVCPMCKDAVRGSDTCEGYVEHMRRWHGVTIKVEDLLYLERRMAASGPNALRSEAMRQAWRRRREREREARETSAG
jgi:hypothetical protein